MNDYCIDLLLLLLSVGPVFAIIISIRTGRFLELGIKGGFLSMIWKLEKWQKIVMIWHSHQRTAAWFGETSLVIT